MSPVAHKEYTSIGYSLEALLNTTIEANLIYIVHLPNLY